MNRLATGQPGYFDARTDASEIAPVSVAELAPGVLVGASARLRHQHPVLAQRSKLVFSCAHRRFVLNVACPSFGGRAAACGYGDDVQRVVQSITDEIDVVTGGDAGARRCALAVEPHVTA